MKWTYLRVFEQCTKKTKAKNPTQSAKSAKTN